MTTPLVLGLIAIVVTIILVWSTVLRFRGEKGERREQLRSGAAAVARAPRPPSDRPSSTVLVTTPRKRADEMICTAGARQGEIFRLDEKGIVIGRDARQAEVVIDDDQISKTHLWVGIIDGRAFAVDRGSRNGTYLNRRDTPRIEKISLQPGDTLIVGDDAARFLYHRGEES